MTELLPPSTPARRRGRPQHFPHDSTPIDTEHVGVAQRIAWVLATSRILSGDPLLLKREHFVGQLLERGVVADTTRISRWESGSQSVPDNVIEAYEAILGLPRMSLVALASSLRRAHGIEPEVRKIDVADSDVLDELFRGALQPGTNGALWFDFATRITKFERVYTAPELRAKLVDKLLAEIQVAVGPAQVTRMAAATVMMDHPRAWRLFSRSAGAHVLNNEAQVVRPAMLLLRHITDDSFNTLTLRLMSDDRPILSRAASGVVAMRLTDGRYGEAALYTIERHILAGFAAPTTDGRVLDSLDLISRLADDSFARVWPHVTDPQLRRRVRLARATGELYPPDIARAMVDDVVKTMQAGGLIPPAQDPDQMLLRLVREALFHVRSQRREQSSQLLDASPYAQAVTDAALKLVNHDDPFVAARAWDLLRHLGHRRGGSAFAEALLRETRQEPKIRGLFAVGSSAGRLSADHSRGVAELAWNGEPDLQYAATFALGMTAAPDLESLVLHSSDSVRRAAAWWLTAGPAITDRE